MNERIRELKRQAMLFAQEKCDGQTTDMHGNLRSNIWTEKFAELIVQDCMTMSDELKAQYLTNRKSAMDFAEKNIYAEGEAACDIIKYKMKRHFGVEK